MSMWTCVIRVNDKPEDAGPEALTWLHQACEPSDSAHWRSVAAFWFEGVVCFRGARTSRPLNALQMLSWKSLSSLR